VFRRRSSNALAAADLDVAPPPVQPARQPSKGRPTPKRSEVERQRRQPYSPAPTDRKAASAKRRTDYQRTRDAARRGEEWALKPADRGPVRALARDYVDSRRLILSEYVLFVLFIAVLLIFFTGAAKNSILVVYVEIGFVALIGGESLYHAGRVIKLAKERLPGESTRGLSWYIAKRAMRLRMSREPQARVQRGATI
jgi:hypothetical protein